MWPRGILRTFLALLALFLLKYVYLATFAHPGADDLCYAAKSRGVPLLEWSIGEYHAWNGRYTSNLLMARGPLSWGTDLLPGYRAVPIVLLVLTWGAAWVFVRAVVGRVWTPLRQAAAALVFTTLFVHAMPDLAEGFYWYTGAITYQLANILLLVHLALLATLWRLPRWGSLGTAAAGLSVVLIAGMSEVHMLLLVGLHGLLVAAAWRLRRPLRGELMLLLIAVACALVVALAPGNAVRASFLAGTHQPVRSLLMSALQTARFLAIWTLSPALLALSLLYIPVHRHLREHLSFLRQGPGPWWTGALLVTLVFACVFPAYWSTGVLGQYRTLNVACFFFLVLWWWNLSAWLEHRWSERIRGVRLSPVLVAVLLLLTVADLELSRNGRRAWGDLVQGRAQRYDELLSAREELFRRAAADPTVTVPILPWTDPPRTLFTLQERDAESRWMSTCAAHYFGAPEEQVRLAP